jgi:hypothetical protein
MPTKIFILYFVIHIVYFYKGNVKLCPERIQQLAAGSSGERLAQFGQNCYEIVNSGVSWSHAEAICKGHGGHLIHIANQQEQDFIFDYLVKHHTHTVWLGLNDRHHEEQFEWTSGNIWTFLKYHFHIILWSNGVPE